MSSILEKRQNIFNAVWAYAKTMTRPAITREFDENDDETRKCWYRHPEHNTPCFMGSLISDEDYDPDMDEGTEGKPITAVLSRFPAVAEAWQAKNYPVYNEGGFLICLQSIHDSSFNNRMVRLREFAQNHDLTIPDDVQP